MLVGVDGADELVRLDVFALPVFNGGMGVGREGW